MKKVQVAVLIGPKSRGSNLQALIENGEKLGTAFAISRVISTASESPGLELASRYNIPASVVPPTEDYGNRLLEQLGDVEWVLLAGYLRLLPSEVLEAFPNRVMNIHPALLPKYGGKGMYGSHVHEAVLAAGETESGCTVHLVTPVYDEGPIVLQLRCEIEAGETPETLQAKVLRLEHIAFSQALDEAIRGRR